jgi:hypothetical protein
MRQLAGRRKTPVARLCKAWLAAKGRPEDITMVEIMRTNDLVVISAVEALLASADLHALVLDGYISALEGGIGAFQRRIMVIDEEEDEARAVIVAAGLGAELREKRRG